MSGPVNHEQGPEPALVFLQEAATAPVETFHDFSSTGTGDDRRLEYSLGVRLTVNPSAVAPEEGVGPMIRSVVTDRLGGRYLSLVPELTPEADPELAQLSNREFVEAMDEAGIRAGLGEQEWLYRLLGEPLGGEPAEEETLDPAHKTELARHAQEFARRLALRFGSLSTRTMTEGETSHGE